MKYQIHAFLIKGGMFLFVWVNRHGVKYAAYTANQYDDAKQIFLEAIDGPNLERPPVCLHLFPRLNADIVEAVEEFTL